MTMTTGPDLAPLPPPPTSPLASYRLPAATAGARTVSTYELLRREVLEHIATEQINARDVDAITVLIRARVDRYQAAASIGGVPTLTNPTEIVERLVRSVCGAGPFQKFLDGEVAADEVLAKDGVISYTTPDGRQVVDNEPTCEDELIAVIQRLLSDAGVTVDRENPLVVHQVWNNRVRASVSIPPVADCLDATFRIYRSKRTDLRQLIDWESLTPAAASCLAAFMRCSTGIVVTGGPGSGKSTILSALLRSTPSTINTRIVQEARELDAPHLPGGRWSPDAVGVSLRMLVLRSLQFAPQLLVVGETRGEEAFELTKAGNAGCGLLTTLHANSAQLGMQSLVTAALMAGENVPERVVRATFARIFDLVIHCEAEPLHRIPPGGRRRRQIMEIAVVPPQITSDEFVLQPLFRRDDFGTPLEFVGHHIPNELETRLNRSLPDHTTIRDVCEGRTGLL